MELSKQLRGRVDEQMAILAQKLLKKHEELQQEVIDYEEESMKKLESDLDKLDKHKSQLERIEYKMNAADLIANQKGNKFTD